VTETLLGRPELLKHGGAVCLDARHGASRFPSPTGEGTVCPFSGTGGTALVSPPLPGVDAEAAALPGLGP
jgi:hypothetical protein